MEPSKPKTFPIKQIYSVYFHYILPFFGGLISRDKKAYSYLPESVDAFPENEKFIDDPEANSMLQRAQRKPYGTNYVKTS